MPPDGRTEAGDRFSFIDLFAGIGGFRLGFEQAGGKCVFTSEWDKFCRVTYEANFGPQHHFAGDIRRVGAEDIDSFDILLAGFPCQPFSIAGVSKKRSLGRPDGFADERQGNLFFEIARVLAYHRPRAFVLENVRNLKGHDQGRTFATIMRTLVEDLGYHVSYKIVDAKSWVPQHRERIIIVGLREDIGFNIDAMPIPEQQFGPRLETVLHSLADPVDGEFVVAPGKVNSKYTLSRHLWSYLKDYAAKHKAKGNGFGFGLVGPLDVSRTLSARYFKDGSEILVKQRAKSPRRLTPRECARLMGFTDSPLGGDWRIPVSDTQAYRQFGNAIVPPVAAAVADYLLPFLLDQARTVVPRDLTLVHG